jgi:flagellar protein FlgJ
MKIDGTSYLMKTQTTIDPLKPAWPDKGGKDFDSILKNAVHSGDQKRLYQACQDMESVLMAKVLNSMRQTIPRSDWMGSSFAMDTFESMLYDEYANLISQSRALGIADVLYRQLSDRLSSAQPPEKSVAD